MVRVASDPSQRQQFIVRPVAFTDFSTLPRDAPTIGDACATDRHAWRRLMLSTTETTSSSASGDARAAPVPRPSAGAPSPVTAPKPSGPASDSPPTRRGGPRRAATAARLRIPGAAQIDARRGANLVPNKPVRVREVEMARAP